MTTYFTQYIRYFMNSFQNRPIKKVMNNNSLKKDQSSLPSWRYAGNSYLLQSSIKMKCLQQHINC